MSKILLLFLIILLIEGCAIASKTYLPSGEVGYSVTCSGAALTWGNCYEKAGEICGARGYQIIDKSDDQGAQVVANRYGLYGGSTNQRNMLIKCK